VGDFFFSFPTQTSTVVWVGLASEKTFSAIGGGDRSIDRQMVMVVGGNFENKFPTPFFKQEKSREKVLRVTTDRKNGVLECYVQYCT
jgi:hypothetical protein